MNSFRNQLIIVALMLASFIGVANAEQVIVFEAPLDTSNRKVSADFAVNRELGRAWIDVQIQSTFYLGEGLPEAAVLMKRVDGLFYDPARKRVL